MKTYVVNGAAHSGFGEETARRLIKNGAKVIGLYYEEDQGTAEKLSKEFSKQQLELIC